MLPVDSVLQILMKILFDAAVPRFESTFKLFSLSCFLQWNKSMNLPPDINFNTHFIISSVDLRISILQSISTNGPQQLSLKPREFYMRVNKNHKKDHKTSMFFSSG